MVTVRRRLREYLASLIEEYRLGLILRLVLFLVVIWIVGATWLYFCERNWTPAPEELARGERNWFATYEESFRHILVYLFSGFEQYEPHTFLGWFGSVIVMLVGSLGVLALLIGNVTTIVQERVHRAGFVKRKPQAAKLSGHIVICNWNERGPEIIRYLRERKTSRELAIVIVAPEASHIPIRNKKEYKRVWAVDGNPRRAEVLKDKANIGEAATAIILADKSSAANATSFNLGRTLRFEDTVDGRSALVAKSIETIEKKVHTIVDLLDPRNAQRFATEAVDEMIAVEEFAERYLARTAQIHGVARVFSHLLSPDVGSSSIQFVGIPRRLAGKKYSDLRRELHDRGADFIVLGFRPGDGGASGEPVLNPRRKNRAGEKYHAQYELQVGDELIVLCDREITSKDLEER